MDITEIESRYRADLAQCATEAQCVALQERVIRQALSDGWSDATIAGAVGSSTATVRAVRWVQESSEGRALLP